MNVRMFQGFNNYVSLEYLSIVEDTGDVSLFKKLIS